MLSFRAWYDKPSVRVGFTVSIGRACLEFDIDVLCPVRRQYVDRFPAVSYWYEKWTHPEMAHLKEMTLELLFWPITKVWVELFVADKEAK